jgi:Na+:H+ antiporter, NhaA family
VILSRAQLDAIDTLHRASGEMRPPGLALEERLHPMVSFVIVPLFALCNAGVSLGGGVAPELSVPVALGVVCGLVLGKQLGVMGASWLAVRSGWASLPEGVTFGQLYGVSCLAGIGFTMSLFITDLAFTDAALIASAKVGILVASSLAGVLGYLAVRGSLRPLSPRARAR